MTDHEQGYCWCGALHDDGETLEIRDPGVRRVPGSDTWIFPLYDQDGDFLMWRWFLTEQEARVVYALIPDLPPNE